MNIIRVLRYCRIPPCLPTFEHQHIHRNQPENLLPQVTGTAKLDRIPKLHLQPLLGQKPSRKA